MTNNSTTSHGLVSVILPMYRVLSVLPRCIDALLAQTYSHLELLFVDDCSPDESAQFIEEMRPTLEARGFVVQVLKHQYNQGVASARNTALEHASGEWVFHYDADDYLLPNAIERLVEESIRLNADVVDCDWTLCHGDKKRLMEQPHPAIGEEAFALMCKGLMKWNLWLFLVRRSLIEREAPLRFIPGANMGEDMMLMGKVFLRSRRVSILAEALYDYTKNDEGQLTGQYRPEHWEQVETNVRELEQYIIAMGGNTTDELTALVQQLKLSLKLPLLISPRQADYDRWLHWMPEANKYTGHAKELSWRTRLLQQAARLRQWWFVRLYYEIVMKRLYSILYK